MTFGLCFAAQEDAAAPCVNIKRGRRRRPDGRRNEQHRGFTPSATRHRIHNPHTNKGKDSQSR